MRTSSTFLAVSALTGLTACSIIGPIYNSSVTNNYDPMEYAREVGAHTVPVKVYGSISGVTGAQLTQIVVNDITNHDSAPHARFTTAPNRASDGYFTVAIMLNGDNQVTGAGLCSEQTTDTNPTPSADTIKIIGSLCRYNVSVSEVRGQISGVVNGAQDPKVTDLLTGMIRELTPANSVYRTNDSDQGAGS